MSSTVYNRYGRVVARDGVPVVRVRKGSPVRDTQAGKLYRAEKSVPLPHDGPVPTVADIERFVNKVVGSAWWKARWKAWPVSVDHGGGRRSAYAYTASSKIAMPKWSRTKLIVLHELAHIAHARTSRVKLHEAWHGREYAAIYLSLVRRFLGVEDERLLKAAFRKGGVKYTPARVKKPMTDEERAAFRDRMVAARAAKAAA